MLRRHLTASEGSKVTEPRAEVRILGLAFLSESEIFSTGLAVPVVAVVPGAVNKRSNQLLQAEVQFFKF